MAQESKYLELMTAKLFLLFQWKQRTAAMTSAYKQQQQHWPHEYALQTSHYYYYKVKHSSV